MTIQFWVLLVAVTSTAVMLWALASLAGHPTPMPPSWISLPAAAISAASITRVLSDDFWEL
jgi:hypothetical protein